MIYIFIIAIILGILLSSKLNINIRINKSGNNDSISIRVRVLYIFVIEKEYPFLNFDMEEDEILLKTQEKTEKTKDNKKININKVLDKVDSILEKENILNKFKDTIKYILDKINWKLLEWETEIGLEDAAITALTVGVINIIKSNIFVYIKNNNFHFKKLCIKVKPNFDELVFKVRLNCIFSIKIGYIIIAGFKLIRLKFSKS